MHLYCTCKFKVYFLKCEMWTMPIIEPINWNISPHHGQLDFNSADP